jgi:hypothetical protein
MPVSARSRQRQLGRHMGRPLRGAPSALLASYAASTVATVALPQ